MNAVFVDASAWYALLCGQDAHASRAKELLDRALETGVALNTSETVANETTAVLERRLGKAVALAFSRVIYGNPAVTVHLSDPALIDEAWKTFERAPKGVSFVDAHSFALMRRLGLTRVFTFDRHFQEAGFEIFG